MTNKLFVYGIFLDESNRKAYGMSNPSYATVKDYCTYGGDIVEAVYAPGLGLSLTGLLVDVEPTTEGESSIEGKPFKYVRDNWEELDFLESGYDRIKVKTTQGKEAWMYVGR